MTGLELNNANTSRVKEDKERLIKEGVKSPNLSKKKSLRLDNKTLIYANSKKQVHKMAQAIEEHKRD